MVDACWRLRVWRGVAGAGILGQTLLVGLGRAHTRLRRVHALDIPEKVRLPALATWTRRAGRATLVEAEAICEARREARTRVEAILSDGGGCGGGWEMG